MAVIYTDLIYRISYHFNVPVQRSFAVIDQRTEYHVIFGHVRRFKGINYALRYLVL